jgi:hypothetical protein
MDPNPVAEMVRVDLSQAIRFAANFVGQIRGAASEIILLIACDIEVKSSASDRELMQLAADRFARSTGRG